MCVEFNLIWVVVAGKGAAQLVADSYAAGDASDAPLAVETISSNFIPLIEASVAEYISKWQERPAPSGPSWEQQYDAELLKDELRPLVFEEIWQQVSTRNCCISKSHAG